MKKRCVSSVLSRNEIYHIYGFGHYSRLIFSSKTIQKSSSADNIICIQYYRNTPTVMAGGKLKVSTIEVSNICLYYLYVLNFIIIMYLSKHDWKNTAWSHSLHYDLSPLFTNIVQLRITVFIVPSVRFVIPYSHTIFSPAIIIIWFTPCPVCEAKTRLWNTVPFPVSRMFISCSPPVFACCVGGKKINYPYRDYFLLLHSVIIYVCSRAGQ